MTKISIFGTLSNIQMLIHTALRGKCVGADQFGSRYYTGKPRRGSKQERRWVMYAQEMEASMVPPEWHGWLHRQTDVIPATANPYRKNWIKPPKSNLTGTEQAYFPPAAKGQPRQATAADYTAWQPEQ